MVWNINLGGLVDKETLPDSIPPSDFSIFRFFTGIIVIDPPFRLPVKMEKSENGIESGRVFLSTNPPILVF